MCAATAVGGSAPTGQSGWGWVPRVQDGEEEAKESSSRAEGEHTAGMAGGSSSSMALGHGVCMAKRERERESEGEQRATERESARGSRQQRLGSLARVGQGEVGEMSGRERVIGSDTFVFIFIFIHIYIY